MSQREIKFRGINVNGEMHYGNLAIVPEKFGNVEAGYYISNIKGKPHAFLVRPETVGEFSGLHDRDGKEIYEGDIIRFPELYETPEMCNTNYITESVVFVEGAFQFKTKDDEYNGQNTLAYEMFCYDGNFEVIGTIYQNPELIKP